MQKILLIEDHAEIRENMAEIMEMANYTVLTADNGKSGIALALEQIPDLIICDITMPELDGYGVLHLVQKNTTLRNVPFIFLTARSERAEIRKGMDLGADDYITKPFDGSELLNAVERRLKKNTQFADLPASEICLDRFKEKRNLNHYKKKQMIYTEGNHPARLYYISKGKVKTFRKNEDGKELIVGLYSEGDFLGYTPILENVNYRECAEALEDAELAVIPRAEFEEVLRYNPSIMKKFIEMLAENINERENKLLATAYNSLRKKVADTLVTINEKYNKEKKEGYFIDFSRDNLASIAGVAKESLIRTLSDFKNENLISLVGSQIYILNYRKLVTMHN
ncbi:cAMP-binding domain of CRP or a regulatory subunit of cAMP-dependent protein kinases [Dyadobacter sp. SG02]|uniref:response regulator n=1 Tax=Dyadobacter sp. SG02 TaxID=1855291 RepID=UPI0008C7C4CE|nr:response regulator [Dyadobacter sp. SG02]SEI54474.1 cAMP-binding domain of CRP or a regulatory subunit of cAMP-dependent protein kinases [Dyadobacter sp. SG02]